MAPVATLLAAPLLLRHAQGTPSQDHLRVLQGPRVGSATPPSSLLGPALASLSFVLRALLSPPRSFLEWALSCAARWQVAILPLVATEWLELQCFCTAQPY